MKISIIVAHDNKLGIGAKNRLLWHIKKDFSHFKTITTGHPVIMGRKTYESIGKSLPGRTNIIVTRHPYSVPKRNVEITHSLKEAIDLAQSIDKKEVFIIGGAEIYRQALAQNLVDKLYVTKVKGDFHADVFFPDYSHFKLLKKADYTENNYNFTFYEFTKH
ncbi:MAG: dihydrofolate reductase [Candidatus Beckwithbacteria bacterium]|nr:dihydrofolate reductase [Candidatus Beckwithbacteria bacterium]